MNVSPVQELSCPKVKQGFDDAVRFSPPGRLLSLLYFPSFLLFFRLSSCLLPFPCLPPSLPFPSFLSSDFLHLLSSTFSSPFFSPSFLSLF